MTRRYVKPALTVLLLAYGLYLVAVIWIDRDTYFWDLRASYYAGRAYRDGGMPYLEREATWYSEHAQAEMLTFLYHPILLWGFAGLSFLDYQTASSVYLLLSAAALAALIYVWKTRFIPKGGGLLFGLLCLLGFNSALYRGFEGGNINTFDVLLIWLAFHLFIRDRPLPFILLIVATSLGKGFPIVLLGLLFFIKGRRKWRFILVAVLIVLAVNAVTYAIHPTAFVEYVRQKVAVLVDPIDTKGKMMPSTAHLLRSLFLPLAARHAIDFGEALILLVGSYLGIAATVILVSMRAVRRLTVEGQERRRILVIMAAFVFALVLPHFKDYAYALLIVPTYLVITRQRVVKPTVLLAAAVTVPYLWVKLPGVKAVGAFLIPYGVVFMTYGLWVIYLLMLAAESRPAHDLTLADDRAQPTGAGPPRPGFGPR